MKKIFVKTFKIIGYVLLSIVGIFLLLVLALQIPKVQDVVKNKAVAYLEGKLKTKVKVGRVEIGLPKIIILEDVLVEDQSNKILLAAKKLKVDVSLLKLMDNEIEINSVELHTITANISKNKQGVFNFDYIVKAFATTNKPQDDEPAMKFSIDKIKLDDVKFSFTDETAGSKLLLNLNHFDTKIKTFDLQKQLIEIATINLKSTSVVFSLDQKTVEKIEAIQKTVANKWKVKIEKTNLENINVKFDDNSATAVKSGIDYKHLDIVNLNLQANIIDYNSKSVTGNILSLSAKEKSSLVIENFKSDFYYGEKQAYLKNLELKTPQTFIQNEIIVVYPSIDEVSKNIATLTIKSTLENTKIAVQDLLIFAPQLRQNEFFANNLQSIISISTKIAGKLDNLTIPKFELSGVGQTIVNMSGSIKGLPNVKTAIFDLKINNAQTTARDIYSFVPKNTVPKNISIPKNIAVKGYFKGQMDDFKTSLNLKSSFGGVAIRNASFNNQRKNKQKFVAQTEFFDFDLGQLIKNKSLRKITLKANVNAIGFDPKHSNTTIEGTIDKFVYNQYAYRNISLKGKIKNGIFAIDALSKDKNVAFDLDANGTFKNQYPSGKVKLNIEFADLQKIKLYDKPLRIRGLLKADIQTADIDYLNGKVSLDNFTVANTKDQYLLDSITLVASASKNVKQIKLQSQFANAEIAGNYKLSTIADALQNSIAQYYNFDPQKRRYSVQNQNFAFNILVKESPILYQLIPDLKALEPFKIEGSYNSVNDSIVLNGTIPKIIYGQNNITNAIIKINKEDNALVYNLFVDDFQTPQFQLPNTSFYGKLEDDMVDYNLQIKDLKDIERYFVAGKLKTSNAISEIILDPKKLLLNYENWAVSPTNNIQFGNQQLFVSNFELSKNGHVLKIQSQSKTANAPLNIVFKDFQIATILNAAQKKDFQIDGKINGNAVVKNIFKTPLFTSDLNIDDFVYQNSAVGNLNVKVSNNASNIYNTNISLTGLDNQMLLAGNYDSAKSAVAMLLTINRLNVASLEGFTAGNIKESTGFLSGIININGEVSKPKIIGNLQFNEVAFKATKLNAKFQSINDKIVFSENLISFNQFKIKDEKNNDLIVDGQINSNDFANLGFDLRVDATNFNAVNSEAKDNNIYYGTLFLDNNIRIKGTSNAPIIDGRMRINKDTKFTIVLPQDEPSIADREGVVEFIDQDNPKLKGAISVQEAISQTEIKGINASINIEIDKEAQLSLIIDKANGDFLKLKGEAQLNGGIDQSGKTTLTGRYDLSEGSYEMNFNLIKRKFDIKKGSYLQWTGEPTTADVSITAVYKTEAAPIDLLVDQLGTLNAEVRNTYKQRIPFETELIMKGALLKPNISFNIVLPDGNNAVSTEIINATQAKLTQLREEPDELNKQVFALLLLNRFIGENPFASESGGATAQGLVRESASKILSQQLNNFAGDLIKGVELDFNLEATEDYTTGRKENRTDLNVGISKTLFNERLKVTVGSSFGLEGPKQENESQSTIGGDISADYQLTKDGRYRVRAYRKDKFQVALQGQVVETGVGFIITIDYNKFKELFVKAKK